MSAPPENREELLKELEQFAFRGIPNLSSPRIPHVSTDVSEVAVQEDEGRDFSDHHDDDLLETQRKRQAELIHQLKGQLEELESYAYESGEGTMPSNILLERQRVVMGKNRNEYVSSGCCISVFLDYRAT